MEEQYDAEEKTGSVDSSFLYFTGNNCIVISGDTQKVTTLIHIYLKDKASGYYEPLLVQSTDNDGDSHRREVYWCKPYRRRRGYWEFCIAIFSENQDFYKNLFETSIRQLTVTEKAITLHLIIVANTNDLDIGYTCTVDKDRTLKIFSERDIVVFYYSGHGYSKPDNYQYPYIELRVKKFSNPWR